MSCVLPIPGMAIFLPGRSWGPLIPAPLRTTNEAPPDTAPDTTATPPSDSRNSDVAGPGPMYEASIDPPNRAFPASVPELNTVSSTCVGAMTSSKIPAPWATKPGAWVRLGKIPSRRTSALPRARSAELAQPATIRPNRATAATVRRIPLPPQTKKRPRHLSCRGLQLSGQPTWRGGYQPSLGSSTSSQPELLRHLDLHHLAVLDD